MMNNHSTGNHTSASSSGLTIPTSSYAPSSAPVPKAVPVAQPPGGSVSSDSLLKPQSEGPLFPAHTPKQEPRGTSGSGKERKRFGAAVRAEMSPKHKSNSTSSLYVDSTITAPDIDQVLQCMATALFYHIRAGHEARERKLVDVFSEEHHPVLLKDQREPNNITDVPHIRTIYKFIAVIFRVQKLPSECAILALAYIERVMNVIGLTLHASNWRRLVLSSIILASKVWEDLAVWNVDFVATFRNITTQDLNLLEKNLLKFLGFNVSVPSSLYAKYYFELRELAEKDDKHFPLRPLDKEGADRLELRARQLDENFRGQKKKLEKPIRHSTGQLVGHSPRVVLDGKTKDPKEKEKDH